jgi:hypothetical protein
MGATANAYAYIMVLSLFPATIRRQAAMQRVLSIALGVVIARERIDHPWQTFTWRPVSVFLNAPAVSRWRELRRDATFIHYHAATLPLTLHPKETIGYLANLATGRPLVYVVLRETGADGGQPVEVALVTASPYDAEVYGQNGNEIVGGVAMPARLAQLLEAFTAEHHVAQPFIKRQRQKHHSPDHHMFGQEPIAELRQRKKREPGAHNDG